MITSMHFNSIDMKKYMLGDLKLVCSLRVHTCTHNVDFYSVVDQNEAHFLIGYLKYNILWYNSAKPYAIHHLIENNT